VRTQILDLAEQLFLSKGFSGFSYADISKPLGIKNAAIHYHFPSKKDLIVSILRRESERFASWQESLDTRLDSMKVLALSIEEIYERRLIDSAQVCIIGNSAVSSELLPSEAHEEIKAIIYNIISWFTTVLESGVNDGEMKVVSPIKEEAIAIAASLAGAVQLSRLAGKEYFYTVKHQIQTRLQK